MKEEHLVGGVVTHPVSAGKKKGMKRKEEVDNGLLSFVGASK